MDEPTPKMPHSPPVLLKHGIHWHVFLTHSPISMFSGAFGFQVLPLFMATACFELATNVALLGGTTMLLPTIATGWSERKSHYHGAKGMIFKRKIADKQVDQDGFGSAREVSSAGTQGLPWGMGSITGYNIIKAESIDKAEKIAKSCPYIASFRVYEIKSM
jgi:hypothetical protein